MYLGYLPSPIHPLPHYPGMDETGRNHVEVCAKRWPRHRLPLANVHPVRCIETWQNHILSDLAYIVLSVGSMHEE